MDRKYHCRPLGLAKAWQGSKGMSMVLPELPGASDPVSWATKALTTAKPLSAPQSAINLHMGLWEGALQQLIKSVLSNLLHIKNP